MRITKSILTILFALLMIFGGVNHFLKPAMYLPFFPEGITARIIIYGSGIVEIIVGIGALIPKTRAWATMGILLLMIAFLPLHILDVFRDNPALGSHLAALIRLPVQFVLIAWAYFICEKPMV